MFTPAPDSRRLFRAGPRKRTQYAVPDAGRIARRMPFDIIVPGRHFKPPFPRPGEDCRRRAGRGLAEAVVVVGLVGFFLLWVLMALPRWRETSRMAGCQKNLMQIGFALQLYHQVAGHYPTVPILGGRAGDSPVKAMLDTLVLPDFRELNDAGKKPKPSGASPTGVKVPGLACPSDPSAIAGAFTSPISYRANAGDATSGENGPFAPGRRMTSGAVEDADGLSFTAAFAERNVGDGRDRRPGPMNYAVSTGPIPESGCPGAPPDRWRGDAGSSWSEAGWRSTLYNHALDPASPRSCLAEDGRTATIGASSSHPGRMNVLLMDGSLRGVTPTMSPEVWRALGTAGPRSAGVSGPAPTKLIP